MAEPKPRVVWVHQDGRTIAVYPDRKVRAGYVYPDEWPVLYRASVPELTDAMWYARPDGQWCKQTRIQ